jgi:hypothetical protein
MPLGTAADPRAGAMLTDAGVTDATTQLQINVILNAFCLLCSLAGTWACAAHGRKPTAMISTALLTVFLFLVGALTKVYGTSENKSGVYGTVACIFLFLGSYSYGWTPVLYLYPPYVSSFRTRVGIRADNKQGGSQLLDPREWDGYFYVCAQCYCVRRFPLIPELHLHSALRILLRSPVKLLCSCRASARYRSAIPRGGRLAQSRHFGACPAIWWCSAIRSPLHTSTRL